MIRNYNLIRAIISEPWFISPTEAETMAPLLLSVFKPDHFAMESAERKPLAESIAYFQEEGGEVRSNGGKVGVLRIYGTLTKLGTFCNYGMEDYADSLRQMYRDPDVSSIIIDFYTPGGTVAGTEELGNVIKESPKPIIAFISDMACSAGYWLASCCDEIIANNTTAEVGSIGVMCSYKDMSGYFEKQGIVDHVIYAPQSSDKNAESKAVKAGDYSIAQENLRVLADKFISTVRENRPAVTEDHLTGKVFFAQDVVGTMVDSIGNFQYAVSRSIELAESTTHEPNQKKESMSKPTFAMLALAAGVTHFESADGTITLNTEQAQEVENYLAEGNKKIEDGLNAAKDLALANEKIKELNAKIEELNASPGAESATVTKDTDALKNGSQPSTTFAAALKAAEEFKTAFNE